MSKYLILFKSGGSLEIELEHITLQPGKLSWGNKTGEDFLEYLSYDSIEAILRKVADSDRSGN